MQHYRWKGVNRKGKIEKGYTAAKSQHHLTQKLLQKNIALLSCTQKSPSSRPLATAELAHFFTELADLLECAIPLETCLKIINHKITGQLVQEVKDGATLSNAINITNRFPKEIAYIVYAGERAGTLLPTIKQIAHHFTARNECKKKLQQAAIAPAITLIMAAIITISLFTLVIPQFIPLFRATNTPLPTTTKLLIKASRFATRHLHVVPLVLLLLILAGRTLYKRYTPSLSGFFLLTQTLALLTAAGTPLTHALELAQDSMPNKKKDFSKAKQAIAKGHTLTQALTLVRKTPPELITCIKIGEQTGTLDTMLQKAAQLLSKKLERRLSFITSLLQPILVIIIGIFVATVIYAIYLPLTSTPTLVA